MKRQPRGRGFIALAVLAVIAALAAPPARAQGNDANWAQLVAAATKEGALTLVVPPSSTHREFLAAEWPKAFPDIALTQTPVPPEQQIVRIKTEREAGKFLWDAVITGSDNGFMMRDAGLLDPIRPELILEDVKDPATWCGWDAAFMDSAEQFVFTSRSYLKMPFYNARLLPPERVAALGGKVFLDPALKHSVIWDDPLFGGSGRTFAPVMLRLLGEDGLRQFVTEQAVFTHQMSDLVDRMARGQFAMSLGPIITDLLKRYTDAGVDLDVRPLGNTPELGAYANTGGSNIVIINRRPHPNATRLFLNWYLSKPVETALAQKMGEDTRRVDVPRFMDPAQRPVAGIKYFDAQTENNTPETRKAQELIAKFRGKAS